MFCFGQQQVPDEHRLSNFLGMHSRNSRLAEMPSARAGIQKVHGGSQ